MHARLWFWLLLTQLLWSGTYVAMHFAVAEVPVGAIVVLRYGLATLGYLLLAPFVGLPRFERRDLGLVLVLGAVNFALAPTLQVTSLRYTRPTDAAILIALEPILTVLSARLVLREKLAGRTIGALALSFVGMLILSGIGLSGAAPDPDVLLGNGLFLASMVCEISVTIAGGRLAKRYSALPTMAAMKAAGFATAALVYFPVMRRLDFGAISVGTWSSILYLALLASLFSYSMWYYVMREAPVSKMALTLYVQPLFGAFLGWLLAGDRIGWGTLAGGALIVVSLLWWQVKRSPEPLPLLEEKAPDGQKPTAP